MPDTNCGDEVTRPPVIVTSALRAPRLAQFVASVSQRPAALPAIGVGIATLVLLSSLAWPVAAGARMLRHGAPAAKPFRRDSALPLSAAAVTMCLYAGLLVLALDKVNASSSPLVLLVGLPTWFAPIYALPWFAGVCALWGAWRLLDRSSAQLSGIARVHRWLVFAALLGVLVTIAAGALLIPIAI